MEGSLKVMRRFLLHGHRYFNYQKGCSTQPIHQYIRMVSTSKVPNSSNLTDDKTYYKSPRHVRRCVVKASAASAATIVPLTSSEIQLNNDSAAKEHASERYKKWLLQNGHFPWCLNAAAGLVVLLSLPSGAGADLINTMNCIVIVGVYNIGVSYHSYLNHLDLQLRASTITKFQYNTYMTLAFCLSVAFCAIYWLIFTELKDSK